MKDGEEGKVVMEDGVVLAQVDDGDVDRPETLATALKRTRDGGWTTSRRVEDC